MEHEAHLEEGVVRLAIEIYKNQYRSSEMGFKQMKFSDLHFRKIILACCSEENGLKLAVVTGAWRLFQYYSEN